MNLTLKAPLEFHWLNVSHHYLHKLHSAHTACMYVNGENFGTRFHQSYIWLTIVYF